MQFNEFKTCNRELMIKFTCQRCGMWQIESLESCCKNSGVTYGYLHNIEPPKDWRQLLHGPLLCPDCYKKYEQFMEG